jgi:hypothetical protein
MIRRAPEAAETAAAGIAKMKETPGAAANRQKEKYRREVLAALENGSYEAGNSSYTLVEFQEVAAKKIRDRMAQGLSDSREKALQSWEQLKSYQDNLSRQIASMPSSTDADMEARMIAARRGMKKFKLAKRTRR